MRAVVGRLVARENASIHARWKPSHHALRFWIPGSEFPAHPFLASGSASW